MSTSHLDPDLQRVLDAMVDVAGPLNHRSGAGPAPADLDAMRFVALDLVCELARVLELRDAERPEAVAPRA